MSGEINPQMGGVVEGRARSNALSDAGREAVQALGFQELEIVEEVLNPSLDSGHVKVSSTGTIKEVKPTKNGHVIFLRFGGTTTVLDGAKLNLRGDHTFALDDTLTLVCDGINWHELARSQSSTEGVVTAAAEIAPSPSWTEAKVEGGTTIQTVAITYAGHVLVLRFGASVTVEDGSGNLNLLDDVQASAGDTLTLVCTGSAWFQTALFENSTEGVLTAAESITPKGTWTTAKIEGSTTIKSISATHAGHILVLRFGAAPTVEDGSNLKLAANFEASPDDTLTLLCNGSNWFEIGRSPN